MQATQRLYPGFPGPSGMTSGRYSPTHYARTRHSITNPTTNLFGSFDETIFQARAEAALVAGMDMKASAATTMLRPADVLSSYHAVGASHPGQDFSHFSVVDTSPSIPPNMTMAMDHHMVAMHPGGPFSQYPHPAGIGMSAASHFAPPPFGNGSNVSPRYSSGLPIVAAATGEPDTDPRELERFAEHFKQRRIKLGVTQADVGKALAHLKMPGVGCLSQSTICRFESLTLSHNNMVALKPILQTWLEKAETAAKCKDESSADILPNSEKKRKRTSIAAPEKRSLEAYFSLQPRPSGEKIAAIAEKLDLKKNVVRVWFCNQRQKQKRCRNQTPGRILNKCSPVGYFGSE